MSIILVNKIQCNHCQDIIESVHIHDFKNCKCGKIAVDGGKDYSRRLFTKESDYTDLSINDNGDHTLRRENMTWGVNYTKDMEKLPETEWRLIKNMDTDHILAILDKGYSKEGTFYNQVFKDELEYRKSN